MATSLWSRLVNAWGAAVIAFNERALVARPEHGWDTYPSRAFRYYHGDAYYNNSIYTQLVGYAARHKNLSGLYKHIRGIYNPYMRLTDLYVAKCTGGMLDLKNLRKGTVPIAEADDRERAAIVRCLLWSNWGTQKSVYVRHGAKYGDTAIKLCDDRARQQVRLEVLNPATVKYVELDATGGVTFAIIEYQVAEESRPTPGASATNVKYYTYTEEIDAESFHTYKDGKLFAFYQDATGAPVSEWPNEYGFVPLVTVKHKDLGMTWGAAACHGPHLRKIDEINDAASMLNDQVRKAIQVIWYLPGVQKKDDLDIATDKKDAFPAVYGPEKSQPYPMVAPLDIAAAGKNIQDMLADLERDMPELALHRVREQTNVSGPGVEAQYSDAVDKFLEARGNYDDGLIRALKMAIAIGGLNGYEDMEGFSLASRDAMEFTMADRPVLRDQLSRKEKIDLLKQSSAPNRAIWEELDVPEDTIQQWESERQGERQRVIDAQAEAARLGAGDTLNGERLGLPPGDGRSGSMMDEYAAGGQS